MHTLVDISANNDDETTLHRLPCTACGDIVNLPVVPEIPYNEKNVLYIYTITASSILRVNHIPLSALISDDDMTKPSLRILYNYKDHPAIKCDDF